MKAILLSLGLALASHAAERLSCADGRYSFEFPAGWVKTKSPTPGAEFARESPDKGAIVSINTDAMPKGQAPDLDATAKAGAAAMAKAIGFEKDGTISSGQLDGCQARFITLIPEKGDIGIVAVFINGRNDLVRFQAMMALPMTKETRAACLGIVQSFKREKKKKEG